MSTVTHAGIISDIRRVGSVANGLKGVININRGPTIDPRRALPRLIPAEGFIGFSRGTAC